MEKFIQFLFCIFLLTIFICIAYVCSIGAHKSDKQMQEVCDGKIKINNIR
jgi:hypothetical protein